MNEINECLSLEVDCGGRKCLALIYIGCMVNLVYKRAYEEMDLGEVDRNGGGELRGIGNLSVPIVAKFREALKLEGSWY